VLYKDWQNIKNLPLSFTFKMFFYNKDKNAEQKIWEMWLTQFPNMDKKSYTNFEDYKKKLLNKKEKVEKIEKTNTIDLLEKWRGIRKNITGGANNGNI